MSKTVSCQYLIVVIMTQSSVGGLIGMNSLQLYLFYGGVVLLSENIPFHCYHLLQRVYFAASSPDNTVTEVTTYSECITVLLGHLY